MGKQYTEAQMEQAKAAIIQFIEFSTGKEVKEMKKVGRSKRGFLEVLFLFTDYTVILSELEPTKENSIRFHSKVIHEGGKDNGAKDSKL